MGEFILKMTDIVKDFPGTRALDQVHFDLKSGEIHALIGENGAGKSTLMNVLMGIYPKDSGKIELFGTEVHIRSPHEALQLGIGIVPQELNMIREATVAENICLGHERRNRAGFIDWNQTELEAQAVLKGLGITAVQPKQILGGLSAAYQQLISIARMLACGSKIIILDEPTASLSLNEVEQLFVVMRQLVASKNTSFIFITHHLDEVKEVSDRITVLRDGKFVHCGESKALTADQMIFHMANQQVERKRSERKNSPGDVLFEIADYSRTNELEGISFSVREKEIFGIFGLVGAGRTELLNTIYGLAPKANGQMRLRGKEVDITKPADAVANHMGYVTEERRRHGIFPDLSVFENIVMPSYPKMTRKGIIQFKKVKEAAGKYIQSMRIKTPAANTQIKNLSGGNQQKVIMARWMQSKADLLLLDEPTRGIDVRSKSEIYKLIREMADGGVTVVMVSSEIEELCMIADRIMVMHEGHIKGFVEDPASCTREDVLKIALHK